MLARVVLIALALAAVASAMYPPIAPKMGTYTWEYTDDQGNDYAGGRTIYDYVSGYVRVESWNTPDANPGINGVTIWDLRENQPIVTTIDDQPQCIVQKLDSTVTAPPPPDFTGYSFSQVAYFNRALTEQWTDGYGGVVYVDVFSRDIVGMGNVSDSDDGSLFMNILSWSDAKPDGTEFLLPDTIKCTPFSNLSEVKRSTEEASNIIVCGLCKKAIGAVIGKLCGAAGTAACKIIPFTVPFCTQLKNAACNKGSSLSSSKACKIVKKC